jgi:hydrogenase nickel incorporation protein HypA/HybF
VHELSVAESLVALVEERLPPGAARVKAVDLRLGALAGVVRGALEFCYGVATEGTALAGSTLRIEEVPVVVHCQVCGLDRALDGPALRCPVCATLSGDIRQGRELDLVAIEYDDTQEVADP